MGRLLWGVFAMLAATAALASDLNMPVGVTETSREVYGLHMRIFWWCVGIAVVVFGAMIYSIFAHRKSVHPKPADFHESVTVEIIWTVIPFVILIMMAIPAAGTLIRMEDTRNAEMTVKITGYQWKWHYEHLEDGVSYYSNLGAASNQARQLGSGIDPRTVENYLLEVDEPLVLPVGKKIRFLLTSNDVIHAWWVPDLAVKKDAVPGYINEMWTRIDEPGIYRGQCAELCGRDHGFMPIVVKALLPAEYEKWVAARKSGGAPLVASAAAGSPQAHAAVPPAGAAAAQPQGKSELVVAGKKVYGTYCAACHQANGQGMAAANFPALVGSALITGAADAQIQQILQGKNAMPAFGYLSDQDIAAAITYTRNSWGNDSGVVQPADVAAQR